MAGRQTNISSFFGNAFKLKDASRNENNDPVSLSTGSSNKRKNSVDSKAEKMDIDGPSPKENGRSIKKNKKNTPVDDTDTSSTSSASTVNKADGKGKQETTKAKEAAQGPHLTFASMVNTFTKVEATTKRLEIIDIMRNFFFAVFRDYPSDLLQSIYLSINKLGPDYEGIELGIGESFIIKAIAESTGQTLQQVKHSYQKVGDLGLIAQSSRQNQPTMFKPAPLTIPVLFKTLKNIASMTGSQSQARKIGLIRRLLSSCQNEEPKYLVRMLEGKLRLNLAEKTIIVSLAHAAAMYHAEKDSTKVNPEICAEAEQKLRDVYSQLPSYDFIIPHLLEHGLEGLEDSCKLTPGVPMKPMLAKPSKQISEVLDRFERSKFTCEYKYDGERAQIHFTEDGKLRVFSRNSEDVSGRYPDIVESVSRWRKPTSTSFILDCEAVGWDRDEHKILPFQILSTRKRKDVQLEDVKVRACIFAFDLLYLNGKSLLTTPFIERRRLLYDAFSPAEGEFTFAKSSDAQSSEDIEKFLENSIHDSCEGLMVKMLDGPESHYEPSKRSRNWLKLKKDYLSGVGDSFDLIVIGAYHGRGKRTSVYGAYLLGCYDPDTEMIQTICKLGTGFSEELLEKFYNQFKDTVTLKPKEYISHSDVPAHQPDVWFEPKYLWEILAADLSLSPVYKAAIGYISEDKGVSLRFPRFVREREDKNWEEATSAEQIAEMYRSQVAISGHDNTDVAEEY
ncbi:ATP-dependent DNA ligase Cdc17 [Schizosaccharomyces japonicus yFS275]|uniref:DNA ligase n=1 Tax=Schizosaccharomyces japonicus (strain yFS275 / FY16936) TaxID=402676 RepID=B6JXQ6_SCHJY|nr:ATP-dependent DNA ligase Cdc17 [Schizosaccharomyces japonicus yFS275]EEB05200.1 ATP-dependent DNA ligase Cdc17 [Schizosaccharomyces japonicus yFS275]